MRRTGFRFVCTTDLSDVSALGHFRLKLDKATVLVFKILASFDLPSDTSGSRGKKRVTILFFLRTIGGTLRGIFASTALPSDLQRLHA